MLKNKFPDSCSVCMNRVDADLPSDIDHWDSVFDKHPLDISVDSGNSTGGPIFLDYRPGNECNLKCRMCSPEHSSQIEKEVRDNQELDGLYGNSKEDVDDISSELHTFVENIQVKELRVLGGEPTIDKQVFSFLSHIVNTKSELPSLRMTINATNLNKKFQDLLSKFKGKTMLSFSIDGTGKTYEYIRTNARWDNVKSNVERIVGSSVSRTYNINIVLTPYNMYNMPELLDWIRTLTNINSRISIYAVNSEGNKTSMAAILPDDMKLYIESIEKWIYDNGNSIDGVDNLLSTIKSIEFSQKVHDKFKKFNNMLDKIRNTSIVDVDARFARYI